MAIYDKDGTQLYACYDVDGDSLLSAYDVNGNKVFETGGRPPTDYSRYSYTQIFQNTDIQASSGTQSFDIFDNKLFWFKGANNGQGDMYIIDLSTGTTILHTTNIVGGHANNASFGGYYSNDDDYPLLYVGGASATMMTYVNRITEFEAESFASTLIKTLVYPTETAGTRYDATVSENSNDVIMTVGYNGATVDDYSSFIVCWWDLTDLTSNGDGTYTPTLIDTVTTEAVFVNHRTSDNQTGVKQSIREHDGMVWIATGYNSVAGYVYAFDKETGEELYFIDLSTTAEVEAIQFVNADVTGGQYMYVGFLNGKVRRYTFGEVT